MAFLRSHKFSVLLVVLLTLFIMTIGVVSCFGAQFSNVAAASPSIAAASANFDFAGILTKVKDWLASVPYYFYLIVCVVCLLIALIAVIYSACKKGKVNNKRVNALIVSGEQDEKVIAKMFKKHYTVIISKSSNVIEPRVLQSIASVDNDGRYLPIPNEDPMFFAMNTKEEPAVAPIVEQVAPIAVVAAPIVEQVAPLAEVVAPVAPPIYSSEVNEFSNGSIGFCYINPLEDEDELAENSAESIAEEVVAAPAGKVITRVAQPIVASSINDFANGSIGTHYENPLEDEDETLEAVAESSVEAEQPILSAEINAVTNGSIGTYYENPLEDEDELADFIAAEEAAAAAEAARAARVLTKEAQPICWTEINDFANGSIGVYYENPLETEDESIEVEYENPLEVEDEPIEEVAEPIVEEVAEPIVEEVAEPVLEEVAEPIVEEVVAPIVVETVIEEPVAEEVEPMVEEIIIEEPKAEEEAPVIAQIIVPEVIEEVIEPVVEEVVEEVVEPVVEEVVEPVVEEVVEPVVEEVVEPVVEEVVEPVADEALATVVENIAVPILLDIDTNAAANNSNEIGIDIDGDGELDGIYEDKTILKLRYKTVDLDKRLCRASEEAKGFYSDIKNTLLSYSGVKSRLSKKFDTFTIGRFIVAKVALRGNILNVYLALATEQLDDKYFAEDVSRSDTYGSTPTLHKVKSKRGCKYGVDLITALMTELNVEKNENFAPTDYIAMYPPENIEEKKQAIANLIGDTIHVDDTNILSDEDAVEFIQIVKSPTHTINKFNPINKFVAYVNEISDFYESGDTVTIESMIEKGALPAADNLFLEVRGKGLLEKKLTFEAHSFDIKAVKMITLTGGDVIQYK